MQAVITTEGAERLANAVALNNKRKLVIPGFRAGAGGSVSEDIGDMLDADALVGTQYPSPTTFYSLTEELPVEDGDNPGNWFIEYGLKLDDPVSTYDATEIGLYAKEYAVTSAWLSTESYLANVDFVSYGGNYYKCIQNASGPSQSPENASYWEQLTTIEDDMLPMVPIPDDSPTDPNPFLYYYIVRSGQPLYVANTHTTIWRVKIGLTQQQSAVMYPTFSTEDCIGFSETQLSYLETIADMANAERALAMEVEALRASI